MSITSLMLSARGIFITSLVASVVFVGWLFRPGVVRAADVIVGAGGYPTINAAIQAAGSGSTIRIHAGTYPEQVEINKTVTLTAFGDGQVWVDGGCSRELGLHITAPGVVVSNFGVKNTTDSTIRIENLTTKNVTVDGMTIQDFDCTGSGPEYKAGISAWYAGSGMRFTNNTITYRGNVAASEQTERGEADCIWFKSTSSDASGGGHYIGHNTITGCWDGIGGETETDPHGTLDGNSTVEYNTVRYCNDDGIQMEGGDTNVHVQYNNISGCGLGVAFAAAITGPLYVEYNTIQGDTAGQYGNLACYKIGNSGNGTIYLTGNVCTMTGDGDGISQTNSGLTPVISKNNVYKISRYIYEFSGTPVSGSSFDYDCFSTSDPDRFVKWNDRTYATLAAFQSATGQELHGTVSTNCPLPAQAPPSQPTATLALTARLSPTAVSTVRPTATPSPTPIASASATSLASSLAIPVGDTPTLNPTVAGVSKMLPSTGPGIALVVALLGIVGGFMGWKYVQMNGGWEPATVAWRAEAARRWLVIRSWFDWPGR